MEALLASLKPPKPLVFDHNAKLNLEVFLNHLETYLKATGLNPQDDLRKTAIFLSHAGEEAQNKFYSFQLTDVQTAKYETVIGKFKEYCKPFKSDTQERYKFLRKLQQNGENFDHFLTDLKCLAKECNFGALEDSLVRDKIVSSVLDPSLQEELLRIPNITLEIVENHCRRWETNELQLKKLRSVKNEADDVASTNDADEVASKNDQTEGCEIQLQLMNSQSDNLPKILDMENVELKVKVENSQQQFSAFTSQPNCKVNFEEMDYTDSKLEQFSIDIKDEPIESPLGGELEAPVTNQDEKPFVCATCGFRYAYKSSLVLHIKSHSGEKPYSCNICSRKFLTNGTLKRHLQTHTGEKPFSCKICNYRCSRKGYLQQHLRNHDGVKSFVCEFCDAKFSQKGNMMTHLRIHTSEKPFACNLCGYRCAQKGILKLHLRTHIGNQSFSCKFCDAKFSQRGNLTLHLRLHTGEKPFACEFVTTNVHKDVI